MIFNDTYLNDVKPTLLDWITNNSRGQNVNDLALSLTNRAIKNLWTKKPWSYLVAQVNVEVDGDNSYTFPADFGRVIDIYADFTGNGNASYWYYEGDDYAHGYQLRDEFTKSGGHSIKITFFYNQDSQIRMRYQKSLEVLTGEGTEYVFFPANLVLLEVQKINAREKGNQKEWKMAVEAFDEEFREYKNSALWVNADATPKINDRYGNEIMTENYALDGREVREWSPHPNSYLGRP